MTDKEIIDIIKSWVELTKKIDSLIQDNKKLRKQIRILEDDKRTCASVKRKK